MNQPAIKQPDFPLQRFDTELRRYGFPHLERRSVKTLQVNVGKLCNQACHHCHVEAGPKRSEIMTPATAERIIELAGRSGSGGWIEAIDLTGGAPELNPSFAYLVESARALGIHVMVRCNLTVLYEPDMEYLPEFYRENGVELICSLPCYTAENVDMQRGVGVFGKSVDALRELNALGYGMPNSCLALNLVYNPLGASLPPAQAGLEAKYHEELERLFGIQFHRLFTITNMPIKRFSEQLVRSGELESYMSLLVNHFNPATVDGVMCKELISIGWDGTVFDCDFNQMLEIPARPANSRYEGAGRAAGVSIYDIESLCAFTNARIATGTHCFGCTAGAGSSCGGELSR